MFLSVVLPSSSRFWLLAFFDCFCAEEKISADSRFFLRLFFGTETTKIKREQPKPRREWQYNAEKHKGKASASRVVYISLDKKICMYECTFLLVTFAIIFISINCFKRNKNWTVYTLTNNDKNEGGF